MSNNCENKIILSCPPNSPYANCVRSETTPPEFSTLSSTCNSVQEIEQDLYTLIGGIKEEIDFSSLDNTCIIFTEPKSPLSVITQMYSKLCELESLVVSQGETIALQGEEIEALQQNQCP